MGGPSVPQMRERLVVVKSPSDRFNEAVKIGTSIDRGKAAALQRILAKGRE